MHAFTKASKQAKASAKIGKREKFHKATKNIVCPEATDHEIVK